MPFTRTQIAERVAAAKEEYDDDDGWTKTDWDKWAKKELRAEQEAATAGEKEWVVQEEAAPKGGARGESTWASIIQEDAASTMGKAEARSYVLEMPLKKHAGKTLGVVLEIDRPYLDWAISIGLHLNKPSLMRALVTLGIISAPSTKTPDEKILVARGLLLQMQTAPFRKLSGLLDAALYELQ